MCGLYVTVKCNLFNKPQQGINTEFSYKDIAHLDLDLKNRLKLQRNSRCRNLSSGMECPIIFVL